MEFDLTMILTVAGFAVPILWLGFRLEKHIANDARVETKLDSILKELYRRRS